LYNKNFEEISNEFLLAKRKLLHFIRENSGYFIIKKRDFKTMSEQNTFQPSYKLYLSEVFIGLFEEIIQDFYKERLRMLEIFKNNLKYFKDGQELSNNDMYILSAFFESNGLTIDDVAKIINKAPACAIYHILKLESHGLIKLDSSSLIDRHKRKWIITPKGAEICEKSKKVKEFDYEYCEKVDCLNVLCDSYEELERKRAVNTNEKWR